MKKPLLFIATLLLSAALAADNNRMRGDFEPDGTGGIVDWALLSPNMSLERLEESGPDGMPVLRFSRKSGTSCSHAGFILAPGEEYSFSIFVRTKALSEQTNAHVALQDIRRLKEPVLIALPLDTDGQWRKIEWRGPCPESIDDSYNFRVGFPGKIPEDGFIDICNPTFFPLSAAAEQKTYKRSTNTRYVGRITPVAPEMCRIDASDAVVDFYYPEPLDKPEEEYFLRACIGDVSVEAQFDERHRALAKFGPVPAGALKLHVELVGSQTGKVLRSNDYQGEAIDIPADPTQGTRLNNFVTELWNRPLADGTDEVVVDADRYLYISTDKLHKGVVVSLDGTPVLTDSKEGLPETMRFIPVGRHTLSVEGVKGKAAKGTICVRLVKNIGSVPISFSIKRDQRFVNYNYGPDYFSKLHYTDGFNQYTFAAKNLSKPECCALRDNLAERGVRVVNSMGMVWGQHPCRYILDEYIKFVVSFEPFRQSLPCLFQENKIAGDFRTKYNASEVWWNVNVPGKHLGVYIEDGNHCEFNRPEIDTPELAGYANSGSGDNMIVEESYYASYPTQELVDKKLEFIRRQALEREALVPTSMAHTVFLFNGWMRIGSWTRWNYPQMDMKAYNGRILQMMATDPAFANIGGVSFSTPSCDDDYMRFTLDAFRYYCIEGKTGDFAAECGLTMFNNHVVNPDFIDGLKGWEKEEATEKGVRVRTIEGLAFNPQRRTSDRTPGMNADRSVGDRFVSLAPGGNKVRQTITGLEKGRLYQLMICSFDYNQFVGKKKVQDHKTSAIQVKINGKVLEYPEMTQIIGRNQKKTKLKGKVFTHRIVFRAKSDTAQIEFTNTSAKHIWGFNYVGVRPYYVKDEAEFKTLLRLYVDSVPVKE